MIKIQSTRLTLLALLGILLFPVSLSAAVGDLCTVHSCSNDSIDQDGGSEAQPIYGDESISWLTRAWRSRFCTVEADTACTTDANRRCIEVALYPEMKTIRRSCESTKWFESLGLWLYFPPVTDVSPYAVDAEDFPRMGVTFSYVIRNCVGEYCSGWMPQDAIGDLKPIQFVGVEYACFGSNAAGRCEERCYPNAPKMFSEIPDCE